MGRYLWPRDAPGVRLRVAIALGLLILAKLTTVATPFLFKHAVDALAGAASPPLWTLPPLALIVGYGAARFGQTALQQVRNAVFARVGCEAVRRLALTTFRHLHALSLRFHLERRTGALNRIVERGVKAIEYLLTFLLFSIAPLALELAMVTAILWLAFDWRYFAVVLVTVAAYVGYTFRITEWRIGIRARMNARDSDAAQRAVESLLNYETVKYFTAEAREAERYDAAMRGYAAAAEQAQTSLAALNAGQALITTAGLVALMAMTAAGVGAGALTVGDFEMVNAYMVQLMTPLGFLGTAYRELRQALIDMTDIFLLIDAAPEVRDRPGAPALRAGAGAVVFDGVHFHYTPERTILQDVSFDAPAGRTLALVGASGAGKSTIARLLCRFYDVTAGEIRVDGRDVRSITQESLRGRIGVAPQDVVLFNDTLGYNIAYGRPNATAADIRAAARVAQLDAFVAALPAGYDTRVGERGLKLSGGEKQRVSIARAVLKDPPILILDEATSALDGNTEAALQEQLRALGRGRTVIAVAHRLSTIVDADEILVLEAGRVVERGDHRTLLQAEGRYSALWRRQMAAVGGSAP